MHGQKGLFHPVSILFSHSNSLVPLQTGAEAELRQGAEGDLREHEEEPAAREEARGEGVVLPPQGPPREPLHLPGGDPQQQRRRRRRRGRRGPGGRAQPEAAATQALQALLLVEDVYVERTVNSDMFQLPLRRSREIPYRIELCVDALRMHNVR